MISGLVKLADTVSVGAIETVCRDIGLVKSADRVSVGAIETVCRDIGLV